MDKKKFIEQIKSESGNVDPSYVETVVSKCLDRLCDDSHEMDAAMFEKACKISMASLEEVGELVEAVAHRVRNRTEDNYEILEECADVILNVLCICKLFDIPMDDIKKAVMVKCRREAKRQSRNQ